MLKELINKILWHPKYNPEDFEIVYLHRGAENNKKVISMEKVISMDEVHIEGSFIVHDTTHIPFHRILEIRNKKTKEILFRKHDKDTNFVKEYENEDI
ncbi:DUF504 domain-containing protein [Methanotorris igneus]|uniref:UPF0248 protein Metig_0836 n=1 Tax=Methanotorris igneus (strain DSM 5666 / JCM 11834 / Kol 5) TaxID=880724 RepID=F6BD20_METIK|nr:DUF504 domain-containing protein [Methanotorris igneus]AEF96381.1 UPF0248 protein [Methanotorris igneus Kol 5]